MAELESSTAIVKSSETAGYAIRVNDFDAAGTKTELMCPLPNSANFAEWSIMQQIVMLKKGMWSSCTPPDIMWGLAYAHQIGADVIKGELFPTGSGRWGTSNKFKIRKALESGNIVGIKTELKPLAEDMDPKLGCVAKKDIECTVTIRVRGWEEPIVRTARLSRWFKKNNPNWVGNPEHMLELNTTAHACELVPGALVAGTEDDEAPSNIIGDPMTLAKEANSR